MAVSLVIDSLGSSLTTNNDTELGLYDESGNLIVSNDNFGSGLESQLILGSGGGADLLAGTYFLAISGFDTTHGSNGFDVTSTSSETGDLVVNFQLTPGTSIDPDFNDDGQIDGMDIDLLHANLVDGPSDPSMFDLTGDGLVTIADRDEWLVQAGAANLASGNPYLLGDANLDGSVDVSDFNRWNSNKFSSSSNWTDGDFNADGFVDVSDFNNWNGNKFQTSDTASQKSRRHMCRPMTPM